MANFNKAILIGRLTRDPETRYLQSGTQMTKFSIAVDREFSKKDGSKDTDFFNIVAWGKLAEICNKYLKKGKLVFIDGEIHIDKNEHEGQMKTFISVKANKMQMLGGRSEENISVQKDSYTDSEKYRDAHKHCYGATNEATAKPQKDLTEGIDSLTGIASDEFDDDDFDNTDMPF